MKQKQNSLVASSVFLGTILTGLLLVAGCGKKASSGPGPVEKQAFDKAPPQLKQAWETVLEADRTNGYVLARRLLSELSKEPLAPEQYAAVTNEMATITQRLYNQANKGDPAALDASRELRRR
jgi:hypothetical protein